MPIPLPSLTPQQQLEANAIARYPTIIREPQFNDVLYTSNDLNGISENFLRDRKDYVLRKANQTRQESAIKTRGPLRCARIAIVPHGPFASTHKMTIELYSLLNFPHTKRIFILSSYHAGGLTKIATPPTTVRGYRTILSDTPWPVDSELITAWNVSGQCQQVDVVQDRQEHGIEIPLLYLHKYFQLAMVNKNPELFPKLIPLFVGSCTPAEEESIAKDLLLPYMKDPETIIIISSDWIRWGAPEHTFYSHAALTPCPDKFNDPTELPQPWSFLGIAPAGILRATEELSKEKGDLLPCHFRAGRRDDVNPQFRQHVPNIMDSIMTEDWMLMSALTLQPDGGAIFRTVRRRLGLPSICGVHAIQAVLAAFPLAIQERRTVEGQNELIEKYSGRFAWLGHARDKTIVYADDHSLGWVCGFAILF